MLLRYIVLLSSCLILTTHIKAQYTVSGSFPSLANQKIRLVAFEGIDQTPIDSMVILSHGNFTLHYTNRTSGMGYIESGGNNYFVVLSSENIDLKGQDLSDPDNIKIIAGNENKLFVKYAKDRSKRANAISAWTYLNTLYTTDTLFKENQIVKQQIKKEILRIEQDDVNFLGSLDEDSYMSWYLPMRRFVSSVPNVAQFRTNEIMPTITAFRNMDYTDPKLYSSGLLKDIIESHFWLIENSGISIDSMYSEMKISISSLLNNVRSDEIHLNEVTNHLFTYLEQHSLFEAAEFLALSLLHQDQCTLNKDFEHKLESYRSMKIGNIATDFAFSRDCITPGYDPDNPPNKISDLKTDYTVVIFAASWCPACQDELAQISSLYESWQEQGIEVVLVSLDSDKQIFKNFVRHFSFISTCDYLKWESPVVNAYHVFATPTMYVLNSNQVIVLRPNSTQHLNSWVDWQLIKGN